MPHRTPSRPVSPWHPHAFVGGRGGEAGRPHGSGCNGLPDQSGMPVALLDVRPLAEYPGRYGPRGRDRRAGPVRPGPFALVPDDQGGIDTLQLGEFFDPRAIPPAEYPAVAGLAAPFSRIVAESHPTLIGSRCLAFGDLLSTRLEVAMGLETSHPEILARLNRRMTLDSFRRAADVLKARDIDLRVFILIRPPWLSEAEGFDRARRSLDFAIDCGASVCSLVPTAPATARWTLWPRPAHLLPRRRRRSKPRLNTASHRAPVGSSPTTGNSPRRSMPRLFGPSDRST